MSTRAIRTFLVIIFIASRLCATPPPDSEAAKLMKGNWAVPVEEYGGTVKDGGYTFRADGTFTSFTVLPGYGQDLRVDVEGKWGIKSGVLIEEVTKSSQPDIVRPGLTTRDALLSVTQKEYRFRTEQGKERSRLRTTARALSNAASGQQTVIEGAMKALSDKELQAAIDEAVRQDNANMPMRVDDRLRLNSVVTRPGKIVIYNYTYVAKASFQRKRAYLEEFLRPTIRGRTLASRNWRALLSAGASVVHRFRDIDGKFIGDVLVSAADVRGPKTPNQSMKPTASRRK